MATPVPRLPTSGLSKSKKSVFPPKRGRIKQEIFGGLARSIASAAARAGGTFGIASGDDDVGGGGLSASSASTTPPTSGYASEENKQAS